MQAVLFDLDGTLIDSLPNIQAAANAVLGTYRLPPLEARIVAGFVGMGEKVFVDRLIAATDLQVADRPEILQSFMGHYQTEARKTETFPGVHKALERLRATDIPMGLVTNKPRAPLGPTLAAAGLAGAFDVVLAGDDLAKRKPDPEPLFHALKHLQAESGVYVGDSEIDAATAKAADMPFVLFTEGIRSATVAELDPVAVFDDFNALPDLIADLLAGRRARA
jgi:phosphoglycolate phosphatase